MKRTVQSPFSLKKEAWKNGAKLETRDGKDARILATDIKGPRPIAAALYYEEDDEELVYYYTEDGFFKSRQEESHLDLVIVEEKEELPNWEEVINELRKTSTMSKGFLFGSLTESEEFEAFYKLIQLRKAWIGDWNPKPKNETQLSLCVIVNIDNEIVARNNWNTYRILSFPTLEMRDEFLKRFEDLIQKAKDLI